MKEMKKQHKIIIIYIIVLVLIIAFVIVGLKVFKKEEEKPVTNITNITNQIDSYGYTLDDRDSQLMKDKFEELKILLNEEKYNVETYISLISEIFIIDYFTINNKVSKYDVGGLEILHSSAKDSFQAKSLNTLYKYVNDNSYNDRTQSLPVVSSTKIVSITKDTYQMDDKKVPSYKVVIEWNYEADLGYQKEGTLVLVEENNKYGIVSFK